MVMKLKLNHTRIIEIFIIKSKWIIVILKILNQPSYTWMVWLLMLGLLTKQLECDELEHCQHNPNLICSSIYSIKQNS